MSPNNKHPEGTEGFFVVFFPPHSTVRITLCCVVL